MNSLRQNGRSTFGYQQPSYRQNNVLIQNHRRDEHSYANVNEYYNDEEDMNGEGIGSFLSKMAKSAAKVGKSAARVGAKVAKKGAKLAWDNRENIVKAGQQAAEFYGSEQGTQLKNMIPSSDANARASFPGEKHAILQLSNGKFATANYMGPGTNVIKRIRRGDPGRTPSDKVAMRHDIDYALASAMKSKEKQIKAIRNADTRMMNSLNKIEKNKGDAKKNIYLGREIIRAKTIGEDIGLMEQGSFGGDLQNMNRDDLQLLLSKRKELGGNGKKPGQKLKNKLIRKHAGKGLNLAGHGCHHKGKGLRLAGQKGGFIFSLAAIIAGITAAATSSTGIAVATAVGGIVVDKVIEKIAGDGMSGKGVQDLVKKYKNKVLDDKKKIMNKIKKVKIHVHELPKEIQKKAQKALDIINQNPSKQKIETVVKFLLPSAKKIFDNKIKPITAKLGIGLKGGFMVNNSVMLEKVMKKL